LLAFYLQNHPDLQGAFGSDFTKVYNHYFKYGINEMRQSSPTFNPKSYQALYPFLSSLSPRQLIWFYRTQGSNTVSGMVTPMPTPVPINPMPTMPTPVPTMPSVSTASPQDLVFDPDFYHNKYPDLQAAFNHDNARLKKHWHEFGIKEGRACSDVLDLQYYLQRYPDLQGAFGTDYRKVYDHFFKHGINELRESSPNYHPKVYMDRYNLQTMTPIQLLEHYVTFGRFHGMTAY